MKAPIHSVKHIVQYPFTAIATGTAQNILIAQGVESTGANTAEDVEEGSLIKAIFIELWLQNSANDGHQIVTVTKDPQFGNGPTFADLGNLFAFTNKKNILFTHEGLSANDGVSGPQNILRQWIKIPKGKQRMGLGDRINLSISNPSSNNLNRCGMAIFKELS